MKKIMCTVWLIAASYCSIYAQAGALDNSFGVGGKVITDFGPTSTSRAQSIAVQSDGKILVAGYNTTGGSSGTKADYTLVRYNTNDTLDNTFDTDGIVTTDFLSFSNVSLGDLGNTMMVQPDGKILVAGTLVDLAFNPTSYSFGVVRYTTSGALDNSFGVNGKASFVGEGYCESIALQADGKILLAGHGAGSPDFHLSRLNSNGTLDNSFGINFGQETYIVGPSNVQTNSLSFAHSVLVQANGKILVAGYYYFNPTGGAHRFIVIRLNSTGSFDSSFGNGGVVYGDLIDPNLNMGSYTDNAFAAALQPDGKILMAGAACSNFSNCDFALVRFNSNGTMDPSFGSNGVATTNLGLGLEEARSIALQSDGKIVLAGTTNGGSDVALVRFTSTGALDMTFDTDGKVITTVGSANDIARSVALQADGKIVVAGTRETGAKADFFVLRYTNNLVGLSEVTNEKSQWFIQPNPSSGLFHVIAKQRGANLNPAIEIYNAFGKLVYHKLEIDMSAPIDISEQANGIYFVRVISEAEQHTQRIVKQE
ncbi:MAG: T9SS type A sorting domain-containing protein [Bacteroidetes bacterium]|nr:T9SS type A sorting domain-containing protein [Bacteroidota bacterium]